MNAKNSTQSSSERKQRALVPRCFLQLYAPGFVPRNEGSAGTPIFVGQASLRRAVSEYMKHYHGERNHQGLESRLIDVPAVDAAADGAVYRHARLGGTLNFYYRPAA